jgi:DNA-binding transcriptional LysR family regulator
MLLHQKFPAPLTLQRETSRCSVKLNTRVLANDFVYLQQMAVLGAGIAMLPSFLGTTQD